MIRISPGEQLDWTSIVKEKVEKIGKVKEVHAIFGRYDLIARVEAEDTEEIRKVVEDIRYIPGVTSTETFIVRGFLISFYLSCPVWG
jgi:DNA-binding Lrp family transcriptional regulator